MRLSNFRGGDPLFPITKRGIKRSTQKSPKKKKNHPHCPRFPEEEESSQSLEAPDKEKLVPVTIIVTVGVTVTKHHGRSSRKPEEAPTEEWSPEGNAKKHRGKNGHRKEMQRSTVGRMATGRMV